MESHIILASFISESDLSIYGLGQKFIRWKLKGVGTLIKIIILTLMEDEQENTIHKKYNKITNFQIQEIPHSTCLVFVSIYCIFKCLEYFRVLFIHILIVAQLQIENFFLRRCVLQISNFELHNSKSYSSQILYYLHFWHTSDHDLVY